MSQKNYASISIFEMLGSKRIGVTILTFQSHVTSSLIHRRPFPISGPLKRSVYSNGFQDILPQTSCSHGHNAQSSLRLPLCKI